MRIKLYLLLFLQIFFFSLQAQDFTKLSVIDNQYTPDPNYSGVAWVDYDLDGDLDLFVTRANLFRNDGEDVFTKITTEIGQNQADQQGNGISWADYDNDGDLDAFLAGSPSTLYSNNGDGTFSAIMPSPEPIYAWACAWADYNNDGWVDMVSTNPEAPFVTETQPNTLLLNTQLGGFEKITAFEFTTLSNQPYTVPVWADYDDDGDQDLFIGTGPANGTTALDFLYQNQLSETGDASFSRITDGLLGTTEQDGQVYNWIDYDNDGDLDCYLTNYSSAPNRFYENVDGELQSVNNPLTFQAPGLASCWGDFDNDGDLDVLTTNESAITRFFLNDNGSFISATNAITANSGFKVCAAAGDYDNDGDLDVYISGTSGRGLFRNDLQSFNQWIGFKLNGTISNKAAIGAKVRLKATIDGEAVWQRRDISAQNSFNGHNSLNVHFGLGGSFIADSIIVEWPSGIVDYYANLLTDSCYVLTEGETATATNIGKVQLLKSANIFPNPTNSEELNVSIQLAYPVNVSFSWFNASGKLLFMEDFGHQQAGKHQFKPLSTDLVTGFYILKIEAGNEEIERKVFVY